MNNISARPNQHKQRQREALNRCHNKIYETKRFYCHTHDTAYRCKQRLDNHLNGKKHNEHLYKSYTCKSCQFFTKQKYQYARHLKTSKHTRTAYIA